MKIGNIIYDDSLINHEEVEFINYFQKNIKYSEFIVNNKLPTLYVGWNFLKNSNSDDVLLKNQSILEKKIISNLLYWEFSFNENKSEHVNGIERFINDIPFYFFNSSFTYINLDPVIFKIDNIDELFDVLCKKNDAVYNYKNEIIYILKENKITGINLEIYKFFNFNCDEVLMRLINKSMIYFNDLDGEFYQKYRKSFPNFDNLKRYMVVLLSNS
jgi:hypothetical protein